MDLNGDGYSDILSGSWPGELFFFKGTKGRSFEPPVMLKDKDGEIINIGGGIEEESGGRILIRGNAEFETTDEGTFVNYHGKRLKSTPEKPIAISGTASTVRAADWDGDGDYDLIVGDISGDIYLIPNEGTVKSYAFGEEIQLSADGERLGAGSRVGPYTADWDGDGDLDLLVGGGDGSVSLYTNDGTAKSPRLSAAVELVEPGKVTYGADAPSEPRRGRRSKVCVADWNGDGKPDLLVGDYATQKPDVPEPTDEDRSRYEQIRKELEPIRKRYGELIDQLHGPSRVRDQEKIEAVHKEMSEISERMSELNSKLPRDYESHGWVWLFLRK